VHLLLAIPGCSGQSVPEGGVKGRVFDPKSEFGELETKFRQNGLRIHLQRGIALILDRFRLFRRQA
jgi:hypothetical protein